MKKNKYIIISGNMGTGKTTLANLISEKLYYKFYNEPFEDNPYLRLCYENPLEWSYKSQIFFLGAHFKQHMGYNSLNAPIVKDCSIYEAVEIYTRYYYEKGFITETDWDVYYDFYKSLTKNLRKPDIIIFIDNDINILKSRILSRGREYELKIDEIYLEHLNNLYIKFYNKWKEKKFHIDGRKIDFMKNESDLDYILDTIQGSEANFK